MCVQLQGCLIAGDGEGGSQSQGGGAGREALLGRLVEQLKGRLQSLREENQQLEDMLHQSDARASGLLLYKPIHLVLLSW